MGYRKQDFIRIRNEYSQKYRRAREAAEERCEQLYEKVPGLQTLDRMLARTSAQLIEVAIRRDSNVEEQIAAIRAQNEKLQAERNQVGRAKRKEVKVNPVRKGAQARRQAAKKVREQRNEYFRQMAIEKSIEKSREKKLRGEE